MMNTTTPGATPHRCAGLVALSLATIAVGGCATNPASDVAGAPPASAELPPEAEEFGVIRTCNAAYPAEAGGMTGTVEMSFQVGIAGQPFNIAIARSEPPGVFDSVALEALACWRFQPEYDTSRVRTVIIEFVP